MQHQPYDFQDDYGDAQFSPNPHSSSTPLKPQILSLLKKLSPPKSKLDLIFDHDEPYLESNIRSASDIFEAMQDEFSFLVPVSLMMSMRSLKIENAQNIMDSRYQKNYKQEQVTSSQESQDEDCKSQVQPEQQSPAAPCINILSLTQDFAYKKGIINKPVAQTKVQETPKAKNVFNLVRHLVRCIPCPQYDLDEKIIQSETSDQEPSVETLDKRVIIMTQTANEEDEGCTSNIGIPNKKGTKSKASKKRK